MTQKQAGFRSREMGPSLLASLQHQNIHGVLRPTSQMHSGPSDRDSISSVGEMMRVDERQSASHIFSKEDDVLSVHF